MKRAIRVGLSAVLVFGAAPLAAGEAKVEAHFAPIEFLVGHCWRAQFSEKQQDVHCFTAIYDGKLIRDEHRVSGTDPLYQGVTYYSWDDKHQRLRFHYFTSTGAVSEGHLIANESGYTIPERHVSDKGGVIEMENVLTRDGNDGYRVVVKQKRDGEWSQIADWTYRRIEGDKP